jgi:hypothetical protein
MEKNLSLSCLFPRINLTVGLKKRRKQRKCCIQLREREGLFTSLSNGRKIPKTQEEEDCEFNAKEEDDDDGER